MKKYAALSFLALGILGFVSCGPCKRISRLSARHPECLKSIIVTDTVKIPGTKGDTVFSSVAVRDTVVLQKDRLTVKYFQSHDTVFLSGECRDSVIIRQVPIKVPVAGNAGYPWWVWFIVGAGVTCFGVFLRRR